jgi:hypothetical protein
LIVSRPIFGTIKLLFRLLNCVLVGGSALDRACAGHAPEFARKVFEEVRARKLNRAASLDKRELRRSPHSRTYPSQNPHQEV